MKFYIDLTIPYAITENDSAMAEATHAEKIERVWFDDYEKVKRYRDRLLNTTVVRYVGPIVASN